jgi:hypothetical protein
MLLPNNRDRSLVFDEDHCSVCGSALVKHEHWKLCPVCEPQFFDYPIPEGYALVPLPTLLDKGMPKRGGTE